MNPIDLLWLVSLFSTLAVAWRIFTYRKLREHWGWLGLLCAGISLRSVYLLYLVTFAGLNPHGWDYSQLQAYTLWPVLALYVAAAAEVVVVNLCRQYGKHNRAFLCCFAGALATVLVGLSTLLAVWIECVYIRWDKPLRVQAANAAERIILLACALTIIAAVALMRVRPLPKICLNLRTIPPLLAAFLVIQSYSKFVLTTHWRVPGADLLDHIAVLRIASALVAFAWVAIAVREGNEWDWEPLPVSERVLARERKSDDQLRLVLRTMWRLAQRLWMPKVL